jgi:type II secretory pathway predicted ATPase ExeA
LLLAVMAERLRRSGRAVVHASLEETSAAELWWLLAMGLELNPGSHETPPRLWRRVCDRLSHDRLTGNGTILLLDDADQAHHDTLAGVLRLLSVEPLVGMQLSIVLASRPAGVSRLSARLVEQAELLISLEPFSLAETREYVFEALAQAGREEPIFSGTALLRLHELSDGVVRRINHLADLALTAAAAQGRPGVDTDIVEGVYQELGAAQLARRIA